jgi:hypothetical protein
MVSKYIENATSFVAMIFDMIVEIDDENMAKIAMVLWILWWRRNLKYWHNKIPPIFCVENTNF